jgi:hypothetical protein
MPMVLQNYLIKHIFIDSIQELFDTPEKMQFFKPQIPQLWW